MFQCSIGKPALQFHSWPPCLPFPPYGDEAAVPDLWPLNTFLRSIFYALLGPAPLAAEAGSPSRWDSHAGTKGMWPGRRNWQTWCPGPHCSLHHHRWGRRMWPTLSREQGQIGKQTQLSTELPGPVPQMDFCPPPPGVSL